MGKTTLRISATVQVDERWASNFSEAEMCEAVKDRLSSSLGFRGEIQTLGVSLDGARAVYRQGKGVRAAKVRRNASAI